MISARWLGVAGVVWLMVLGACGESEGDEAKPAPATGESVAADKTAKREKKPKKDRGNASMKLGDTAWEAERTKAKIKSGHLRIDASRMDMAGKKVSRQQLTLILPDYKGPGTYQARPGGSMFVGVGLNKDAVAKADTDDKVGEVATDAISKSQTILLMKTTVVVESESDTEIVGTFSQPALGRYPAIADGKFRAVVSK